MSRFGIFLQTLAVLAGFAGLEPLSAKAGSLPRESISVLSLPLHNGETALEPEKVHALPADAWSEAPRVIPLQQRESWLRLRLTPDFTGQGALYLLGMSNLEKADFFYKGGDGQLIHTATGVHVKPAHRGAFRRQHGVVLAVTAGQPIEVYFRSYGYFGYGPSFRFEELGEFNTLEARSEIFTGFHAALILLGALFILLLGTLLQSARVDAYLAFSVGMLLASLASTGNINLIFQSWGSELQPRLATVATLLPIFGSILFTQSFLSTAKEFPRLHRVLWLAWIGTAGSVLFRLAFPWNAPVDLLASGVLATLLLILNIAVGIRAVRKRLPQAGYFLFAWSVFFGGVVIYAAARSGWITGNYLTLFAPLIAQLVEVIVLIMALIRKFGALFEAKVEGDRARTLLRVLSHDLGGSVSAVKLSLEQLGEISEENGPAGELKPLIDNASHSIRSVESLLGDLREFLSLKSQKVKISLAPVSLTRTMERLIFDFQPRLEKKKVVLHFEGDWSESVSVWADFESLCRSVLGNALSNAIKFSHPQGVIRLISRAQGRDWEIAVADEGVGMSAALLAKVLDPDAQTSRSGTAGEAGTGFGMPILADYAKNFGGSVQLESTEGKGTTVRIRLRLARVGASPHLPLEKSPHPVA